MDKPSPGKYPLIYALLLAIAFALLKAPLDQANANPPDPTPTPGPVTTEAKTRLPPDQATDLTPPWPDASSSQEASLSPLETRSVAAMQGQQTLYPLADTMIMEGYPAMNYGNSSEMWAGYDVCLNPYGKIARSLVRFDIDSLPPAKIVTGAKLRLYLVSSCDHEGASWTVSTYRVTASWTEDTVTWNNKPDYGEGYGSQTIAHGAFGWYEFDVTNLVRNWYTGSYPNYGILLGESAYQGRRGFSTREAASEEHPQLVVEYTDNTAPVIAGLPDQTLPVNSSLDNAILLWAYTTDAQSPDPALVFTIANTPDPGAGVSIDNNVYIDIAPALDWAGQTTVTIQATDPGGLFDTDSFTVTVTRPNTPPQIDPPLPDQTLPVNGNLDNAIDLWAHTSDADSADADLAFTIINTPDPNAGVSIDSNRYLDIAPALDWTGQTTVTVRASDPGGLFDTDSFTIRVISITAIYGVQVAVPASPVSGRRGEAITFTIGVTNTGNIQDSFAISLDPPWTHTIPAVVSPLGAGQGMTIDDVTTTIPPEASLGARVMTITATSYGEPAVSARTPFTVVVTSGARIYLPLISAGMN